MVQRKKKFKERIRQNDLKQRHKVASQMRERMGAARRRHNRFDRIDNGSRPLEEMMEDITEGSAIPIQETQLDPRGLTDLLMKLTPPQHNFPESTRVTEEESSATPVPSRAAPARSVENSSKLLLSEAPLPADHPLALPDPKLIEEEEAAARKKEEEEAMQRNNKNKYRHHGQAHLFWERSGLHPLLLQALRTMKFTHPTPTQEEVLPVVLEAEAKREQRIKQCMKEQDGSGGSSASSKKAIGQDKDVLVSAETGSGKTLVFALPILQRLFRSVYSDESLPPCSSSAEGKSGTKKRSREEKASGRGVTDGNPVKKTKKDDGTASPKENNKIIAEDEKRMRIMHSLILSPTRELALQILQIIKQLCQHAPAIRIGCIVGGMAAEKQQRILNQQPHILIATPGRLWELVQKNEGCYLGHSISRRLQCVVLDEADRMLHAGKSFEELKQLLARIHCEILPAGFIQEREEGAEAGEHEELEAGRWDEELQRFISFKEAEKLERKRKEGASSKLIEETNESKSKKAIKDKKQSSHMKKSKVGMEKDKKKGGKVALEAEEDEEDEEEFEDGEEEEDDDDGVIKPRGKKKDDPKPMPMPPDPPSFHRVITFVTSATLSLQTNYERRDYSATKSVIRTSNADVMGKVLQELSIKPSNALVFNVVASGTGVAAKINETYLRCPEESKDLYMYYFLKTYAKSDRTIIFVNAISMLRRLVKLIEILGISVVGLHASMQQRQRLKFIDRFKKGDIKVLVATDVASRGLDIDDLRYVLHFQVPRSTDAYIHRCGRTARCGATGLSLLLVNAQEHMSFRKLLESTGRKESELETFALQPTVVHQLHAHLRIALQIDKLNKEITKSRAKNNWVSRMSKQVEIDASDMIDDEADNENREKSKAIKILQRELQLLQRKFVGAGGKGAFRTGSYAIGAQMAEEKLTQRALRQTFSSKKRK